MFSTMLSPTLREEQKLWNEGYRFVAGMDEVGRGAWAGPIVVAAVLVNANTRRLDGVRDSKFVTPRMREQLYPQIIARVHAWSIGSVAASVIDRIGIMEANRRAMRLALEHLPRMPEYVLTDAFPFLWRVPCRAVRDGDGLVYSIAAASILAKVWRDRLMTRMHARHPLYGFDRHKGYRTRAH